MNSRVGVWSDRRRNFLFGLVFMVGASYGAPIVRSSLGLSALETDLITGVNQGQVSAPNRRLYVVAGVALAVVAFAATLLVGKNP